MGLINDLRTELLAAKAVIEPQIEGLRDFERLNLQPSTSAVVAQTLTDFERRLRLINEGITALDNLLTDSYPNVPTREVLADVFEDLEANLETLNAAFAKFQPQPVAVSAEIIPSTPREK